MLSYSHHAFLTSFSGIIKAAFSFLTLAVVYKVVCNLTRPLLWCEFKLPRRRMWSVAVALLSLQRNSYGVCVIWGKPLAILSSLSSSSLCQLHLPLSALVVHIFISPHLLLLVSKPTKCPTTLLPHGPHLLFPSSTLVVHFYISSSPLSHFPISICLPNFLFPFPIISSSCHSSHLCSLNQYSVPSSYHQALHHLTHLRLLAGLEHSVHPVLWFSRYALGLPSVR